MTTQIISVTSLINIYKYMYNLLFYSLIYIRVWLYIKMFKHYILYQNFSIISILELYSMLADLLIFFQQHFAYVIFNKRRQYLSFQHVFFLFLFPSNLYIYTKIYLHINNFSFCYCNKYNLLVRISKHMF